MFISGRLNRPTLATRCRKPLSGGTHEQFMEQRPTYRAGVALDITLAVRMSRKVEIAIGAAGVLIGSALMMSGKAMCRTSCWADDIFRYLLPNNLASLAGGIPWVLVGFAIIVWSLWRGPK
jgi:hypothetical protein